ncbi:ribose 5-phosphate isomerase B [candidate division LCP-89 bacterium B3_LCP]|uniref:Ribose 5-phosphate isomerase B n=1 Tax=candidate division LCP-89 bacterium B3_LCP TaxID=2012998 RepID=A0A532V0E6_UNCL8|nr:MAG: ribose 5-phosphate isomerase B [candidate division LCP-89 bacterium B3_LCP]
MKISIASDHAGFTLKERLKDKLKSEGHDVFDRGCFDESSADYPDFGIIAARDVADGVTERAVLVCGSGIGMSMVANKVRGVRAALCTNAVMAEMSRLHNDANVLTLGARYTDENDALEILDIWMKTSFEGGRHQRRVDKIGKLGDY